jgi:hypothetical protein
MAKPAPQVAIGEPEKGDPLFGCWHLMSHGQRRRWYEIRQKYDEQRRALDSTQTASREKNSRYPSAAPANHERDIDEHVKINEREHAELRSLRAEVKTDLSRQQHERDQRGAA